jgi:Concanavalin A-like lectin/glucanases superfamily
VGNATDHANFNQCYQFGFWNNARSLVLAFNTNGQAWPGFYTEAVLPASLPTNVWLPYAATYDHNAVTLYLNGVPLKTNVIGAATVAH